jgi:hypothetical protein
LLQRVQLVASSVSGCRVPKKLLASLGQLTNWPCLEDEYAYQYAHGTAPDFPMSNTVEVTILAQQQFK